MLSKDSLVILSDSHSKCKLVGQRCHGASCRLPADALPDVCNRSCIVLGHAEAFAAVRSCAVGWRSLVDTRKIAGMRHCVLDGNEGSAHFGGRAAGVVDCGGASWRTAAGLRRRRRALLEHGA